MLTAVHLEFNLFSLFLIGVVINQIHFSVNKQASRRIFMILVIMIAFALVIDSLCVISDGHHFLGARILNNVSNAFYFSLCSLVGFCWTKYVITRVILLHSRKLDLLLSLPALAVTVISFLSIKYGFIFYIDGDNYYQRGRFFIVHLIVSFGYLIAALIYVLVLRIMGRYKCSKHAINFIMLFYILPTIGSVFSTVYSTSPGLWPATALSMVMVYIDMQDYAITTDGLTGLSNRKILANVYRNYSKDISQGKVLVIFMVDLNKFKQINDTLGHLIGDEALVNAAGILKQFVSGTDLILVRYGGDEFLIIGLLNNEKQADVYKDKLLNCFDNWNRENSGKPYRLMTSVGYQIYREGDNLEDLIERADKSLYKDKKKAHSKM